ncbi:MAG: hypothetical protein OXC30_02025 [Alphaproteobacteria bacterium]|nr:hypothetical protein [Alphaproteobacteria bacterium]
MLILLLLLSLNIHASEERITQCSNIEYLWHMRHQKSFRVDTGHFLEVLQGIVKTDDALLLELKRYNVDNYSQIVGCINHLKKEVSQKYSRQGSTVKKNYLTLHKQKGKDTILVTNVIMLEDESFQVFRAMDVKNSLFEDIKKSEDMHHYRFVSFAGTVIFLQKSSRCALL